MTLRGTVRRPVLMTDALVLALVVVVVAVAATVVPGTRDLL